MNDLLVALVTHLLAAACGGWGTYAVIMRRLRVTEHDGHLSLEVCPPGENEENE